ncbi:uncharacterized protein LOC142175204 [Nicotiana tabacum]|uniref:Uncharacterized protein LOC142175204 n=1 Tax=Nicotiana tabacum TaxID=4097 RepID=A0AC58TKZ7_TOBAC
MAIHKRLSNVDRLARWGIQVPIACVLCIDSYMETQSHLFFECPYSSYIRKKLLLWVGVNRQIGQWESEIGWLSLKVNNMNPTGAILGFLFAAAVYHIWMERNLRRCQQTTTDNRVKEITLQLQIAGQRRRNGSIFWIL